MNRELRQSTAVDVLIGQFIDDTDFKTAEEGLTIAQADVRLSKNAAATAQKNDATSCTHREDGNYSCPLNATDTNTLGSLSIMVTESGALPVREDFVVISQQAWDSKYSTDKLQVDVREWSGTTVTGDGDWAELQTDVDAILVDTDTTIPDLIAALNDLSSADVTTACETAIGNQEPIEANVTQIDGLATNGNNATLNLKRLNIVNNDANPAMNVENSGSGDALELDGGGTGTGLKVNSDGSAAVSINSQNGNGVYIEGGGTSGKGMYITASGDNGDAIYAVASGNGDGLRLQASGTGKDINADQIDDILEDTGTTIPALIAALNDLSSADVTTACETAIGNQEPIQADLRQILGTAITESSAGRIANNWDFFFDNADAQTAKKVDDVGGSATGIADAVWDELTSGHTTPGSFGVALTDILTDTATTIPGLIAALNDLSSADVTTACETAITNSEPIESNLKQINDASVVGNLATLTLKQLDIQNNAGAALIAKATAGSNHGVDIAGSGTGDGVHSVAGSTGHGMYLEGGSVTGNGLRGDAKAGASHGAMFFGFSTGHGMYLEGGATGYGLDAQSGVGGGVGARFFSRGGNGAGVQMAGNGSGAGLQLLGGGSGKDIDADEIDDILEDTGTTIPALIAALNDISIADVQTAITNEEPIQADVRQILGTAVTESSGGRIAGNWEFFFDNSDSQTAKEVDDVGGSATGIADAVWDELTSGHVTPGSFGVAMTDILTDTATTIPGLIAALNDLSSADVTTACETAITNSEPIDANVTQWNSSAVTGDGDWAEMQTDLDAVLVDTGTTIPGLISALNDLSSADVTTACETAITNSEPIDSNVTQWDGNGVTGDGDWSELQTDVDAILVDTGTTIPALIAALNDLSSADVTTACETAIQNEEPIDANTTQLGGSAADVTLLKKAIAATETGIVGAGAHTTTSLAATDLTGLTADAVKYRVINFTAGNNQGRSAPIIAYVSGNGAITLDSNYPLPATPVNGDTFTIT